MLHLHANAGYRGALLPLREGFSTCRPGIGRHDVVLMRLTYLLESFYWFSGHGYLTVS